MKWLKNKILKWLGIEKSDIIIGADFGIRNCEVIICALHSDGSIKVLSEYNRPGYSWREFDREIRELAKRYKAKWVVKDGSRHVYFDYGGEQ